MQVRALAVSAGRRGFALADIEAQGWFAATKDGPYGLTDMRKARWPRRTGGALPASRGHPVRPLAQRAGHMGVWGGVPVAYRRWVAARTADAIVAAWRMRRAGRLYYGTAPGRDLLSNQFDYDAENQVVDSDVRVLQARDRKGRPFATLLDFSAHPTVLGADNTKVSGDWVSAANPLLEQRFGGRAMTVVGTLGRTQPADRGCTDPSASTADAKNLVPHRRLRGRASSTAPPTPRAEPGRSAGGPWSPRAPT